MKIENKILILSLIFFIILYTVFRLLFKPSFGYGYSMGVIAGLLNFRLLARSIRKLADPDSDSGSGGGRVLFFQLRLAATAYLLWFAIAELKLNIIGILVGLSVLPVCVLLVAIYNNIKGKKNGTPA